jgi:SH3-like domain-containing protein
MFGQVGTPQEMIQVVKTKYAPDKRVAIFDVNAKRQGKRWALEGETNLEQAKQALLKSFREKNLDIRDNIRVLEPRRGVVNISVCNIRSQPKHSAELSTQSLLGTPLKIYKEENGWYYVQTPDGYLGWLDDGGFSFLDKVLFEKWRATPKVVVNVPFGFVTAGKKGPNISDVVEGDILAIKDEQESGWVVSFPDGRTGFLAKTYGENYAKFLSTKDPDPEQLITTAYSFMGRPYLWGGTSGKGMDCSGFTKTVFYLNGLELPRDASQQVHVGEEVPTDTTLVNLKRGDFIFFGRKATSANREKVTHVAIYLGDGKIIHASDRIQVQSLKRGDPDFVEYRLKSMVRVKRMLDGLDKNGVKRLRTHPEYAIEKIKTNNY